MDNAKTTPLMTRLVEVFLRGDVAMLLVAVSLVLGVVALWATPREEEPQIVVPMADVFVSAPGLSAEEVERKITTRLEKLLYQIDGVEYVYSMSRPGECIVTVRFYVGEDRENSIVKLYNKVHSNVDQVPPAVTAWVIKPVEVDDVPIVNVTLWSDRPKLYGDHELRRLAEQLQNELQSIPDTSMIHVIGGRPRQIRVELDPARLAARRISALQVAQSLQVSNVHVRAGRFEQQNEELVVESGTFVADAQALGDLVIGLSANRPIYLRDVATVLDGPAEVDSYSWIGFGKAANDPKMIEDEPALEEEPAQRGQLYPAVHITVAKQKGRNAVSVAADVERRMEELAATHLPDGVFYRITRDYGETANEKVNELVEGLVIAVITVVGLIGLVIGWRPALVVALAIPVCYSLTLFVNLLAGYTINRVTLFALILSLGLLVDDPITDVENIARYFALRTKRPRDAVLAAIQEVRPALIMSTLAIIASFLPLMFITGMMGPYMAPMAVNVPLTVTISTIVAFVVTPWLAMVALRRRDDEPGEEPAFDLTTRPVYRISRGVLGAILDRRWLVWVSLGGVALLLTGAMLLPAFRVVPLKMLPYDNKNEFQIVVDMPEGTTLEETEAVTRRLGQYLAGVPEVRDYQLYVGLASPMDFNGMVRHYFLRKGANVAEIRVNLAPKERRAQQSHSMLLRIRNDLTKLAEDNRANIKLVEVPPGPPVLATVTAEVYGPPQAEYEELIAAATRVRRRMQREPRIVDVDISAEDDQKRLLFTTDKAKAALSGVSTQNIAETMQLALDGMPATVLHEPGEVDPLWVQLRVNRSIRSAKDDLEELYVRGEQGQLVQIGALGKFAEHLEDKTIYHKNLRRVVYVYGEVAGRPPADAIIDMQLDRDPDGTDSEPAATIRPANERTWLAPGGNDPWSMPVGYTVDWAGEGEWKITLDVFRDLGLAFAAAQIGIFVLLMFQTGSRLLPLVIMMAIPLTLIGIMPGFWLLNLVTAQTVGGYPDPIFLTATAMIGMIALSGIVVRNSVVLIDFIHHGQAEGLPLREAIIRSVAVRTRPILLTAGTTLLGNWVITLDPVFSGLAWAIIFGILASTIFTLLVIPVMYWLLYGGKE
ncbi:MAG: efflux RND transporter permease subunit [Candidatus Nealsonbacteria bacterium]|nr:efflux RND transporter permease subunit [Candidatus Nealsonbacteria bacterium]